ncbi:hypothetical protein AB0C76_23960 [Kitasatospora sp. NPDC048722]|uniref:hypothetical protein n=1 Tax=Kitasatospora sp. NPDC048722 TaxID=3155639 RepID=UPI0033F3BAA7
MQMYSARPGGRTYYPVLRRLSPGTSVAVTLVAGAVLAAGLALAAGVRTGWPAVGAYAALCALMGTVSRPQAAPLTAISAWLFFDGFTEHRYAELGWSGAEAGHLALFAAVALATGLPAAWPRRRVRVRALKI